MQPLLGCLQLLGHQCDDPGATELNMDMDFRRSAANSWAVLTCPL